MKNQTQLLVIDISIIILFSLPLLLRLLFKKHTKAIEEFVVIILPIIIMMFAVLAPFLFHIKEVVLF